MATASRQDQPPPVHHRSGATGPGSEAAARRFIELLGANHVDLVVDLEEMTGYTTDARRVWQECFYPVQSQLHHMYVLGHAIPQLIRMGATVVAAYSGIPVRFFPDLAALDAATTGRAAGRRNDEDGRGKR